MKSLTLNNMAIPQARTLPFIGDIYRFAFEDAISYFCGLQRRFGAITKFKLGPINAILVTDPDLVAQVLGRDVRTYIKGEHFNTTRLFLGDGLFVSEKQTWRQHRKMLNPKFSMKEVERYSDIVAKSTNNRLDKWLENEANPFDMPYEMCQLTMDIIIRSMFGTSSSKVEKEYGEAVRICLDFVMQRGGNPFPLPMSFPLPSHIKFKRHKGILQEFIFKSIKEARKEGSEDSLIKGILTAEDEDTKIQLSDEQIKDEVLTVFLAGHETTALALSWAWYLIGKHPEVEAKMRAEIKEVIGDRPINGMDTMKLQYIKKVAMEVLRLFPPVGFYPRESTQDQKLGPYDIKNGDQIMLSPYITQRLSQYWENPNDFDPDRFENEKYKKQHSFAYFPFGMGKRICMGQHFAMMEMVMIIAITMQKVQLKVHSKGVKPKFVATLRPNRLKISAHRI